MKISMQFVGERSNGARTCFGFSEITEAYAAKIKQLQKMGLPDLGIFELVKALTWKHLRGFEPLRGIWFSSDVDPDAAANDISDEIYRQTRLQVTVAIYDDNGSKINNDECQRGTFVVMRKRNL